jgi:hypothetical protein
MKRTALFFMLILLLTGCATSKGSAPRTVNKVISGDLAFISPEKTRFAMYPVVNDAYLKGGEGTDKLIADTRDSISRIMVEKGYDQVAIHENPDFFIGFGLGVESKISDDEIFEKAGMVAGLSTEGISQRRFQKGTVMVAVLVPGVKEPRWRVMAQGFSDKKVQKDVRMENLHQLLEAMLASIPNVKSH